VDRTELELLVEVCRLLDRSDELEMRIAADGIMVDGKPHPLMPEQRQVSLAIGRLVAQLGVPADDGGPLSSPRSARARRAAQTRWDLTPRHHA
jgi:hypothetical protein